MYHKKNYFSHFWAFKKIISKKNDVSASFFSAVDFFLAPHTKKAKEGNFDIFFQCGSSVLRGTKTTYTAKAMDNMETTIEEYHIPTLSRG